MSHPTTPEQESPRLTSAVQMLIAINFAIIVLQVAKVPSYTTLATWLSFDSTTLPRQWWTAVTYMFVHANPLHFAANMYGLYIFGPRLEHTWGSKKFVWFYLLCGLGGAAFEMLFIRGGGLMGASAPLFGVLTAYAMQWPDDELALLFLVPVRARTLAAGVFGFNLVLGIVGTTEGATVAYFAHIGGAVVAYIYMRMATTTAMDHVRQRVANLPDADEPPRAIPRNLPRRERGDEVDDIVAKSKAIASKRVVSATPTPRRRDPKADELNRVLDKISEQGIESLTSDERKVLEDVSRLLRDR